MWFSLNPVELYYETTRSKERVVKRLNEVATFDGDRFKIPVNYSGNKLFRRSKFLVGEGIVTIDEDITVIKARLHPAGGLQVVTVIYTVIALILFLVSIILLFTEAKIVDSIQLLIVSAIFLAVPRIIYFVFIQLKKDSIENLIL